MLRIKLVILSQHLTRYTIECSNKGKKLAFLWPTPGVALLVAKAFTCLWQKYKSKQKWRKFKFQRKKKSLRSFKWIPKLRFTVKTAK